MKKIFLAMMLGAFFIVGCGDEETPNEIIIPCSICPPDTPDELMENFERIYTDLLIADFRELLDPDFQLILSSSNIEDWDWEPGSTFDFDTMISIHENMFGGSAGSTHEGFSISPLDRIEISYIERIEEWVVLPEENPDFPGVGRALFEMKLFFHDNTGIHAFAIDQEAYFYVSSVDGNYYLRGINPVEYDHGKGTEAASYESFLSFYR